MFCFVIGNYRCPVRSHSLESFIYRTCTFAWSCQFWVLLREDVCISRIIYIYWFINYFLCIYTPYVPKKASQLCLDTEVYRYRYILILKRLRNFFFGTREYIFFVTETPSISQPLPCVSFSSKIKGDTYSYVLLVTLLINNCSFSSAKLYKLFFLLHGPELSWEEQISWLSIQTPGR
jgi:hypothetical protein